MRRLKDFLLLLFFLALFAVQLEWTVLDSYHHDWLALLDALAAGAAVYWIARVARRLGGGSI